MALSKRKTLLAAVVLIVILASLSIFEFYELHVTSPIRVACIGDSITRGTEYTIDLWKSLGQNYIVCDLGVGGAAVAQVTGMSYARQAAFGVALNFKPNIVIIMLGTNDAITSLNETNAAFIADYSSLVHSFQSLSTKPTVWLVEPPPIYDNTMSYSNGILIKNVIPNIIQVANQTHTHLIDAYTPLLNHPELFVDGIHPSADGAKIIAQAVYTALISQK
ncbi:MAG: GDSL-type esterase/lipase family protein [Candidatus Bathyarchaeia archaeon]|jgi:sialate O-acetylesterase